jgi:hypothetical protein
LVKDSCGSVGNIYCFLDKLAITENIPTSVYSDCHGGISPVTFSRNEIRSAIGMLARCRSSQAKGQEQASTDLKAASGLKTAFTKNKSRLAKTLLMLQAVRQSEDRALKIAHYCSCFEILFGSASDKEAISHKIAERIAVFLGGSSLKERVAVFEDIRDAYGVRCAVFHGTFLKPASESKWGDLCVRCDDLLRATLRRILESTEYAAIFEADPEEFDEYFRDYIFGAYQARIGLSRD